MDEIRCIDEYLTRLELLPVCSCGYIFKDGVVIRKDVNEFQYKSATMKYPQYFIEPNICPNCKKVIECIEYNRDTIKREEF